VYYRGYKRVTEFIPIEDLIAQKVKAAVAKQMEELTQGRGLVMLDFILDFFGTVILPESIQSNRQRDFDKVFVKAKIKFGNFSKASEWLDTPHPELQDNTPRYRISKGDVRRVLRILDGVPGGSR
jgi:hypothetical protein